MGFPIPANDPGPPSYTQPPDDIRSDTLRGLLERDRFIFATGRRCLVKCGGRLTTGSAVVIHTGTTRVSGIATGNVWLVASGYEVNVGVALGSGVISFSLGSGFDTYAYLHLGWISAGASEAFAITLDGRGKLFGLAIYEERLPESLLP